MDDIKFAAQCLVQLSNSRFQYSDAMDLTLNNNKEENNEGKSSNKPSSILDENTKSSSYMVSRILTDLKQIEQEPVPEVPSSTDSENNNNNNNNCSIKKKENNETNNINNNKKKERNKLSVMAVHIDRNKLEKKLNSKEKIFGSKKYSVNNNNNNNNNRREANKIRHSSVIGGQSRKVHKCSYDGCYKSYGKSSHLKAHLRTHTEIE